MLSIDLCIGYLSSAVYFLTAIAIPAAALISVKRTKHRPRYFYTLLIAVQPALILSVTLLNIVVFIFLLELVLLLIWAQIQL
jgi:NADH:ubiquinone oxidoreductase subunit 4 (subunit M)